MSVQDRTLELCDKATYKNRLKKWTRGYVPKHYKRLNIPMDEAYQLAVTGVKTAMAYFDTNLFFTQALIFGACVTKKYKTIVITTTSQYGKSWLMGQVADYLAFKGKKVLVSAGTEPTTEIIMSYVTSFLQNSSKEIQEGLLNKRNVLDKLNTSLSKKHLSWSNGGEVQSLTLGATTNDPKKQNKAIGRSGIYMVDEAGLVPDESLVEIGRREFSSVDGNKELLIMISNPHREGMFYDMMTEENPPKDTLIIWMDVRTAIEEGRISGKAQVEKSVFFKNRSTCQRYLLCELENYSEESMFGNILIDDSEPHGTFFLGLDSAYKGNDKINGCLGCKDENGYVRVVEIFTLSKGQWIDGVTSEEIIEYVMKIIRTYNVKHISVDVGWGVWLVEGLAKRADDFTVLGVNFGASTTKKRKEANHFSAKYGFNLRAEMYLDLQELVDSQNVGITTQVAKKISKQMEVTRTIQKAGGKTAIIPKDEIKQKIGHSPDELDSVVLMIHSVILYSMQGGIFVYAEN